MFARIKSIHIKNGNNLKILKGTVETTVSQS